MSQNPLHKIPGMHDILPMDQLYMSVLKKHIRYRSREAGFKRINTHILEDIDIINRSLGTESTIVQNQMFTIQQGDKTYALRPENTTSIARAYIEHDMTLLPQPIQLYYMSPMFRSCPKDKKSYQQFFQFGLEVLGEKDATLDAQIIHTGYKILQDAGIADNVVVQLNSIGDYQDRADYKEALQDFFIGKERLLTENSKNHLNNNPLRILQTKDEDEQILLQLAPKIQEFLSKEAQAHYTLVKEYLIELEVPFVEKPNLVRGFDYYNRTTFEFTHKDDTDFVFMGGGRYDDLIETLGGPSTPAIGFAGEMEQIITLMKDSGLSVFNKDKIQVFVGHIGTIAKKQSLSILSQIRDKGIKAMGSMGKSSIPFSNGICNKI